MILLIVVCSLTLSLNAQNPPPPVPRIKSPPPVLIYKVPDKSTIITFESKEFDFKCGFNGKPVSKSISAENHSETHFNKKLKGANQTIKVSEFKFDVEKEFSKTRIFEYIKSKHLYHPDMKLEFEKEFDFDGIKVKEFGVSEELEYKIVRAFVVKNRIYEILIDVTNWHILKRRYKKVTKEFEDESQRFFNSCKINQNAIGSKYAVGKIVGNVAKKELKNKEKLIEYYSSKKDLYVSEQDGFELNFIYKPVKTEGKVETAFGKVRYIYLMHDFGLGYSAIYYFDYPKSIMQKEKENRYVQDQVNRLNSFPNSKLIEETKLVENGISGQEYVYEINRNTFTMRIFFVGNRTYQLLFVESLNNSYGRESRRAHLAKKRMKFYNSFKLLGKSENK